MKTIIYLYLANINYILRKINLFIKHLYPLFIYFITLLCYVYSTKEEIY